MNKLQKLAKKIPILKKVPILPDAYRALRDIDTKRKTRVPTHPLIAERIFTEIYKGNKWGGKDSVSGIGSDDDQTKIIANELSSLFHDFSILSMLDMPCGDFHWMKNVDLSKIDYTGADIIEELIQKNTEKYGRNNIRFQNLNLITDKLPKVDLVFSRDCFVHFSFTDIFLSLTNVCNSQSKYLLTTTFTSIKRNYEIVTGNWRVLNLELAPFTLPRPIKTIIEGCSLSGGIYKDKALGLWRIADIQDSLTRCSTRRRS